MLVSGRSSSWQGASFNAGALTTGNTYQVSAWVKLAAGEPPAGLKITGKRQDDTDSSTYLEYSQVATATVTADEWVQLKGSYTPDGTTPFEAFLLESDDAGKAASFMSIISQSSALLPHHPLRLSIQAMASPPMQPFP